MNDKRVTRFVGWVVDCFSSSGGKVVKWRRNDSSRECEEKNGHEVLGLYCNHFSSSIGKSVDGSWKSDQMEEE